MTTVHANIRRLREAAGITASEAARRAEIHQGDWSDIERGKNENPTQKTLAKVAAALGCTLAELFVDEDGKSVTLRPMTVDELEAARVKRSQEEHVRWVKECCARDGGCLIVTAPGSTHSRPAGGTQGVQDYCTHCLTLYYDGIPQDAPPIELL